MSGRHANGWRAVGIRPGDGWVCRDSLEHVKGPVDRERAMRLARDWSSWAGLGYAVNERGDTFSFRDGEEVLGQDELFELRKGELVARKPMARARAASQNISQRRVA